MNPAAQGPGLGVPRRAEAVRKLLALILAVGLSLWAASGADPDGSGPSAAVRWTILAVAFSLAFWALTRGTRWSACAAWAALAFAGQACALQLLWVGSSIRLQMFWGWSDLLGTWRGIFLLAIFLQAIMVARGVRRRWPAFRNEVGLLFTRPEIVLLLALLGFAATTIAPALPQSLFEGGVARQAALYASKVALGLFLMAVGGANLLLAAAEFPQEKLEEWTKRWQSRPETRWPRLAALWVVAASSALAWYPLERMPHVPDELAYIFQANYYAEGRLYLPPPPDTSAIRYPFQIVDGERWYSSPPAGWPFALALGVLLGVPWLVNPLLGGAAILLAHAFVRRLYSRELADGTVFLLAASPWLLFLSASLMPHPLTLVLSLASLLGVTHARDAGSTAGAAIAGLCIGGLLHVRPLEAVIVASVAGLWWLSAGIRRMRLAAIGATLAGGAVMSFLFLSYNQALTGDAMLVPINKFANENMYEGANALGFGRDVGNLGWRGIDPLPGHGPIDVVVNTNQNLYLVNFEMFGWACGSLVLVALLLVWGRLRDDAYMWWLVAAVWAGMSFYWFSGGPDFGARYWYQMILPLALLTARGAQVVAARIAERTNANLVPRIWAAIVLASVVGALNLVPWRSFDKYYHYRGIRADVQQLARQHEFGRSLVMIRGQVWPDYAAASVFNGTRFDPEAPGTIYAFARDAETERRLRGLYPGRPVWILAGPSLTRGAYRVVEAPE